MMMLNKKQMWWSVILLLSGYYVYKKYILKKIRKPLIIDGEIIKYFDEIPKTNIFKQVFKLLCAGGPQYGEIQSHIEYDKQFGPIYWNTMINYLIVSDPQMHEKVRKYESSKPNTGSSMDIWKEYFHKRGNLNEVVLVAQGDDWLNMRRATQKFLLSNSQVNSYVSIVRNVVDDSIPIIVKSLSQNGNEYQLGEFAALFASEAIGAVVFGRQLGTFYDSKSSGNLFGQSITNMFKETAKILFSGAQPWKNPNGKQFLEWSTYWNDAFIIAEKELEISKKMINEALMKKELDNKNETLHALQAISSQDSICSNYSDVDENILNCLLAKLIVDNKLSDSELLSNITVLFAGGIDTTASTFEWIFHHLSLYPKVQDKLFSELDRILGGRTPDIDDLPKLTYLNAVIKESMRLVPPIVGPCRILSEDIELGGYMIPAGTPIGLFQTAMVNNEEIFPNAKEFIPDRWIQNDGNKETWKYASYPFSLGPRQCIGAKVAQMELQIFFARLCQDYILNPMEGRKEPKAEFHLVTRPCPSPAITFIPRK